ncbi:MAG TPA: hypothetical protein VF495_09220, partial [Phenylobacterium sp.]
LPHSDLEGIRLGVTALGFVMLALTSALRWSWGRRFAAVAGGLLVIGEGLPRHLGSNAVSLGIQVLAIAAIVGARFPRNSQLRVRVSAVAALLILGVEIGEGQREGVGWVVMLWPLFFCAAAAGLYWLMKLGDKLMPSPEARGAAEVSRLRAERRAALRTGTTA